MLDNYINKRELSVCSIEQLNHDLNKDELLLSNDNRNDTIIEEEEDDLFDLYITPYSEKQQRIMRARDLQVGQDTTILKGSQREESVLHGKMHEQEAEVKRLKKIIMKKNNVIGDLTEELKIYYQQSKKKQGCRKAARSQLSAERGKQNECQNNRCRTELLFFQKNNMELYEELVRCKEKCNKMEVQLGKASEELREGKKKMSRLEGELLQLRRDNANLLKQAKQYISQGTREIKIISKMREVLAEKLSLKEMNIQIPDYQPKAKSSANQNEKVLIPNSQKTKERAIKSVDKNCYKENSSRERCLSHDANKHKLNS